MFTTFRLFSLCLSPRSDRCLSICFSCFTEPNRNKGGWRTSRDSLGDKRNLCRCRCSGVALDQQFMLSEDEENSDAALRPHKSSVGVQIPFKTVVIHAFHLIHYYSTRIPLSPTIIVVSVRNNILPRLLLGSSFAPLLLFSHHPAS